MKYSHEYNMKKTGDYNVNDKSVNSYYISCDPELKKKKVGHTSSNHSNTRLYLDVIYKNINKFITSNKRLIPTSDKLFRDELY